MLEIIELFDDESKNCPSVPVKILVSNQLPPLLEDFTAETELGSSPLALIVLLLQHTLFSHTLEERV